MHLGHALRRVAGVVVQAVLVGLLCAEFVREGQLEELARRARDETFAKFI